MHRFVSYLRVSTGRQEASGLGIEAQREAVRLYLDRCGGDLVAEHVEVESGAKDARPALHTALALCRRKRATLLIARLDRLSRSLSFIAQLLDAGVDLRCADMPEANRVTIQLMAVFAEHERSLIRARTKAALAAAKARGVILGANGAKLAAANKAEAQAFAENLRQIVQEGRDQGHTSLRAMGAFLTAQCVPTVSGGAWHPRTVQLLLNRLTM